MLSAIARLPEPSVAVEQSGKWVSLGEFSLAAGTTTVELSGDGDGYVVADAVRVLRERL